MSSLPIGPDLAYGVATSAYQVEGASTRDGRGASIWDTFAARPGTIRDGSDGSVACASYDRLDEDLDLVAALGVGYYRFSVAWPRVQPSGSGPAHRAGIGYYDRLVDGLLARGVTPLVTLYHWDLPQPLEDAGGWPLRDTALRFADYTALVNEQLGDRVALWATLNEPWCSAYLGYASGVHAPGRREPAAAHRAAHHLLLAHGLAAQHLHEAGSTDVGIALNLAPVWPERPAAAATADAVDALRNRVWLGPIVDGAYDEKLRAVAPTFGDPDVVRAGDLELVRGSADWLGVNYYTPERVDVGEDASSGFMEQSYPGATGLRFVPREPRTAMGWEVEPRGLEEVLLATHRRTGLPLVVTENGAAYDDAARADDGAVDDEDRISYLRDHIAAVERARASGADVRAFVAWTLLDNFEWAEGYTKRFGLVEVDAANQRRRPKASYRWYAERVHAGTSGPNPSAPTSP